MNCKKFDNLQATLGHVFSNPSLLHQALVHSSMTNHHNASNERLEFLGDRVLGLVLARMLFNNFDNENEGELGYRFSALAQRNTLSRIAEDIGLADTLLVSKSELDHYGTTNPNILANALEAVIAALYLDGGLSAAENFIRNRWVPIMEEDLNPPKDPKTILQEWAQGKALPLPTYTEKNRSGPDHGPKFVFEVEVKGHIRNLGKGQSKRSAQQAAALAALRQLGIEH
jgi:ribonuclease III